MPRVLYIFPMMPYFSILNFELHTGATLYVLTFLVALIVFIFQLKNDLPVYQLFLLVFGTSAVALIGARGFHVIFERPELLNNNSVSNLLRLQGLTFYGSFFAGVLFIYFFNFLVVQSRDIRTKIWNTASIITAFAYSILRIGCFMNGCCWGKITPLPWAVTYYAKRTAMPFWGIPVHPVQIYDAIWGLITGVLLIITYKKIIFFKNKLFYLFCLLYSIGRIFTEQFRGDSFRGDKIFLNLSTGQLISIVLFFFALVSLYRMRRNTNLHNQKAIL